MKLKGARVKKIAGARAASRSVEVEKLAALADPNKVVKATFTDGHGAPALAGLAFRLKTPSGEKKGEVSPSGVVAVGDLKPGRCELELTGLDEDGD